MRWTQRVFLNVLVAGTMVASLTQVCLAEHPGPQSGQVTITGIVPAVRWMVVNSRHDIVQIFSNTDDDVPPKVFLGTPDGPVIVPDTTIMQRYYDNIRLVPKGKTGVVYRQPLMTAVREDGIGPTPRQPFEVLVLRLRQNSEAQQVAARQDVRGFAWPWLVR